MMSKQFYFWLGSCGADGVARSREATCGSATAASTTRNTQPLRRAPRARRRRRARAAWAASRARPPRADRRARPVLAPHPPRHLRRLRAGRDGAAARHRRHRARPRPRPHSRPRARSSTCRWSTPRHSALQRLARRMLSRPRAHVAAPAGARTTTASSTTRSATTTSSRALGAFPTATKYSGGPPRPRSRVPEAAGLIVLTPRSNSTRRKSSGTRESSQSNPPERIQRARTEFALVQDVDRRQRQRRS